MPSTPFQCRFSSQCAIHQAVSGSTEVAKSLSTASLLDKDLLIFKMSTNSFTYPRISKAHICTLCLLRAQLLLTSRADSPALHHRKENMDMLKLKMYTSATTQTQQHQRPSQWWKVQRSLPRDSSYLKRRHFRPPLAAPNSFKTSKGQDKQHCYVCRTEYLFDS